VIAPIVPERAEALRHVFAGVVTLVTERDASVPGVVPGHGALDGQRALELLEQLVCTGAGDATLQVDDGHGHGASVADRAARRGPPRSARRRKPAQLADRALIRAG
jgi:hypothetical protein